MQKAWLSWSNLLTRGAIALGTLSVIALCPASTLAQLIPDGTLGAESSVITANFDQMKPRTIPPSPTRGEGLGVRGVSY